jgi:hypothetical protein
MVSPSNHSEQECGLSMMISEEIYSRLISSPQLPAVWRGLAQAPIRPHPNARPWLFKTVARIAARPWRMVSRVDRRQVLACYREEKDCILRTAIAAAKSGDVERLQECIGGAERMLSEFDSWCSFLRDNPLGQPDRSLTSQRRIDPNEIGSFWRPPFLLLSAGPQTQVCIALC